MIKIFFTPREGQLRVAQVSAAELKSSTSDIDISNISAASGTIYRFRFIQVIDRITIIFHK